MYSPLRATMIWGAATLTIALGFLSALLVLAVGWKNRAESYCGSRERLPRDIYVYTGPSIESPVTFRCEYAGHPDVIVTDWLPLWGTVTGLNVTLVGIAVVVLVARRLARST